MASKLKFMTPKKPELHMVSLSGGKDSTAMLLRMVEEGMRMDFTTITNEITNNVAANQQLLEEYIRFRGALIELGKIGNAFTAELSNEKLSFKENGQEIAFISNQALVITNAEIRNRISLGTAERGWFDFIPRTTGNLSIQWRDPVT